MGYWFENSTGFDCTLHYTTYPEVCISCDWYKCWYKCCKVKTSEIRSENGCPTE